MEIAREFGVATFAFTSLINASARPNFRVNPTLAAGDVKIIRYTGYAWNVANLTTLPTVIAGATTQVLVSLTDAEMTIDETQYPIVIQFIDQTGTKEWDDQEIVIWVRPQVANVKEINGDSTNGYNATLKLQMLDISNVAGTAIRAIGGSGGAGIIATGNQYASGIQATGGNYGHGILANGGVYDGDGIQAEGAGNGHGFHPIGGDGGSGSGIYAYAGSSGDGITATGGNIGCRLFGWNDGLKIEGEVNGLVAIGTTGKDIDADEIDGIKAKTDTLPAAPANEVTVVGVGSIVANAGYGNAAIKTAVDAIVSKLPSGNLSNFTLQDTADGITISAIMELVMAMVNGRYRIDYPSAGNITFYKRDNSTVLFTITRTNTERTRV